MGDNIGSLIYRYRMMGFDNPKIEYNKYFRCYVLVVNDPCGQWKIIKGNSEYACIIGALKWARANWDNVQGARQELVNEYPKSSFTMREIIQSRK